MQESQTVRAEWMPAGLFTASEIATMLDVRPGTIKGWQRDGRLTPQQYVIPPQGGSAWRFYAEEDARALAAMRDYRAPLQRISAVEDEVRAGTVLAEALRRVGVSRTTWNYWVRHRRDAAAVAGAAHATADHGHDDDAREVMARVLSRFEQGSTMQDALAAEGLSATYHQKWLTGPARCEHSARWFGEEYCRIRAQREAALAERRKQRLEAASMGWAGQVGWVYFVSGAGKGDAVKIGWASKSVADRVAGLQIGSPVELRALASVVAMCAFERWCHRQFADDRLYGEWFRRTPRLLGFIDRLAAMGDVSGLTPTDMAVLLQNPQTPLFGGTHGPTP